jgi:hypothetical protein
VHPLHCKAIASARLKNDRGPAAILEQLLRTNLLPEAWIAPSAVRAVLRHWAQLVRLRTLLQPDPCGPRRMCSRPTGRVLERAGRGSQRCSSSDQHSPERIYSSDPEDVQICPSNPSHPPTARVTGSALIRLPDVGER